MKLGTRCALTCLLALLAACEPTTATEEGQPRGPASLAFPDATWQERTPASQGVNATTLEEALGRLAVRMGGGGVQRTVVVRNGYLIWKGPLAGSAGEINSITKVFTSTVLGRLLDAKRIALGDKAAGHWPALDDAYPGYSQITIQQLATMTSGFGCLGGSAWDSANDRPLTPPRSYTTPGPAEFPAGTSYNYSTPPVHLLGHLLARAEGKSLAQQLAPVATAIGLQSWSWASYGMKDGILENNPSGVPSTAAGEPGGGGVHLSALDLARLGMLYLAGGTWNGQRLLSQSFVDQATSNRVPVETGSGVRALMGAGRYGFFWWTDDPNQNNVRAWPSAPDPKKTYLALGGSRHILMVIPEWQMVVVRLEPSVRVSTTVRDRAVDEFLKVLGPGVTAGNLAPTVELTRPTAGASFSAGAAVNLAASAADVDGEVARVEFYAGATRLGDDSTSPYTFRWSSPPAGTHALTARAVDNRGAATTSAAVSITVGAASTVVGIVGDRFTLNGALTYPGSAVEGRLLNVRMVNGVFEDKNRAGFDPAANTQELIARLPQYVGSCAQDGKSSQQGTGR